MSAKEDGEDSGLYERSSSHLQNFIDAVKAKIDPLVLVEVGQRTTTTSILCNIATKLNRPVNWPTTNQYFTNDPEAETHYNREYHNGNKL